MPCIPPLRLHKSVKASHFLVSTPQDRVSCHNFLAHELVELIVTRVILVLRFKKSAELLIIASAGECLSIQGRAGEGVEAHEEEEKIGVGTGKEEEIEVVGEAGAGDRSRGSRGRRYD
eukprot:764081-Hanusia_phi.AAC.4